MSNKIKIARSTEQEYAHNYNSEDYQNYQYPNEESRVKANVESDSSKSTEELYNVSVGDISNSAPVNKIRARLTSKDTLEDHRQRAYKVNNRAPIQTKSDPGNESYQLSENPRDVEVNYIQTSSSDFDSRIKEEHSRDLSKPEDRFAEFSESESEGQPAEIEFIVGLPVKHKEEGITGTVKFVGNDKLSVVWEDQTRERFSIADAKSSLESLSYVDDTQSEVDPLNTESFPKTEEISKETDEILNKALAALDEEVDLEDDATSLNKDTIEKVKKKAAMEIIDLMQSKGLLPKNKEAETNQINQIIAMSDNEFETFKNKVIAGKLEAMDLALMGLNQEEDFSDIEDGNAYAKMKAKVVAASEKQARTVDGILSGDVSMFENGMLKAGDFKASVGDFSGQTSNATTSDNQPSETRNIKRSDNIRTAAPQPKPKFDFSGFKGLEGLTKPINIPNQEVTTKAKFADAFGDPSFWTTISKIH